MSWQLKPSSVNAELRCYHREAQKRKRELEQEAKEQAKLSAIEQARFEVRTFENRLEVLLSIHKEQGPVWDWHRIAASLPPPPPQRHSNHELRARQEACLEARVLDPDPALLQARLLDEKEYQVAVQSIAEETLQLARLRALACRILSGDLKAYTEALVEFSPLGELSELGSTMNFVVHTPAAVEIVLNVKGVDVIPTHVKRLTTTEKLSVKPMARTRFHEVYQDYICSCILRVGREVFALLPVTTVLVTACASGNGAVASVELAVFSVVLTRAAMAGLDFETLDPSDAMENFLHRGDFKASRKAGAFGPIVPLTPDDIMPQPASMTYNYTDLVIQVQRMREQMRSSLSTLMMQATAPNSPSADVVQPDPSHNPGA